MRAKGKEEGTHGTRPQVTGSRLSRASFRSWARTGPLVNGGMKKVRDPRNSTAAEKVKVFRIGLESEGAAKDPLT